MNQTHFYYLVGEVLNERGLSFRKKLLYPATKTNKSNYINGVPILHTRGKLDLDELHVKATHQRMDYITFFGTTL